MFDCGDDDWWWKRWWIKTLKTCFFLFVLHNRCLCCWKQRVGRNIWKERKGKVEWASAEWTASTTFLFSLWFQNRKKSLLSFLVHQFSKISFLHMTSLSLKIPRGIFITSFQKSWENHDIILSRTKLASKKIFVRVVNNIFRKVDRIIHSFPSGGPHN